MADITPILIKDLSGQTVLADTDYFIVGGVDAKKITVAQMKSALGINKVGKTAKYYAGTIFYQPADNAYHGIATGTLVWNDIDGLNFVADSVNYKHYYTFPEGTYLINIGIFTTTVITEEIGTALQIRVDDVEMYNPWFRLTNNYQSISYSCIIKGSKLQVLFNSSKVLTISNSKAHTFVSFMRLS